MSFDLQTFSDIQAELADLSTEIRRLSASQPKAKELADAIDAHLQRGVRSLQEDFVGKFAGLIEPFLKSTRADVEKVGGEQTSLEERFANYLRQVSLLLEGQKKEIDKILTADAETLRKMLAGNAKKIEAQQAALDGLLELLRRYDKQFVDLHNGAVLLAKSNEELIAKTETAVERLDNVSAGPLEEIAVTAKSSIELASISAEQGIRRASDAAWQEIEVSRKRYLKVLGSFDNRILEHPMIFVVCFLFMSVVAATMVGAGVGRWAVASNTRQMIDEAVASSTAKVDEKMAQIEEQTKSLSTTFENAQYWEALTQHMNYEEKMRFIKTAREAAERYGRKTGLPKSMQPEKAGQ